MRRISFRPRRGDSLLLPWSAGLPARRGHSNHGGADPLRPAVNGADEAAEDVLPGVGKVHEAHILQRSLQTFDPTGHVSALPRGLKDFDPTEQVGTESFACFVRPH
jgi:hypothetical protein